MDEYTSTRYKLLLFDICTSHFTIIFYGTLAMVRYNYMTSQQTPYITMVVYHTSLGR